ncbi:MAG TPA: HEAT repeat domain-containing protein [Anaerolineae bacterium]|nr:HEAT repeat domain-containing protein [Anaerolineae bacterium]HOQ97597.1 HEAT repeat domain-containing protein [Anaerolineae bacterium]HPL29976.1 HEAT repeat domain-containing protein [Anaerolineae bacterium]
MSKIEECRATLRGLADWEPYLLQESGLPGPRGNLELMQAVADEGAAAQFHRWAALTPEEAPGDSPQGFLACCGAVGLGRLAAEGDATVLPTLRRLANDPRWRLREAVAMALQRLGDADMEALLAEMEHWSAGTLLERRAAAAALCEPRLLGKPAHVERVLGILHRITAAIPTFTGRKSPEFCALAKGLSYCWSVAVCALPEVGKGRFEVWLACTDPDVRRIMRENLKKNRLARMDAAWVARCQAQLA